MMIERYSFKTLPLHLRDTDSWPEADVENATPEQQERFARLMRGLKLYLKSGKLSKSAKEAQCSPSVLLDQLNRCIQVSKNGQIEGWAALISYQRIKTYVRKAESFRDSTSDNSHRGLSGIFEKFLEERPNLREEFHKIIRNGGISGSVKSSKASKRDVFKTFQKFCLSEKGGMKEGEYPWQGKSRGRRSVERYIEKFAMYDSSAAKTWFGPLTSQIGPLGSGLKQFELNTSPFDRVQFDSHKIDCIGTLIITGPAGLQPIVINRMWINVYADQISGAVLGIYPSFNAVGAGDILSAARTMIEKWEPKPLPEGLRYLPGACLPAGNIEKIEQCRPCVISFDNYAPHFGAKVNALKRFFGCALAYNPVGAWWCNSIVERLFETLEEYGFQKLPSAVQPPHLQSSEKNPAKAAQHNGITWELLVVLVDAMAANFNVTKSKKIGNQKPIDYLVWRLSQEEDEFLPRLAPPVSALSPKLGVVIETLRVGGSSEEKKLRAPYIEIDGARYACPELIKRRDLIGKHVTVHIDEQDMRAVEVFEASGRFIGTAVPLKHAWRQTKHTRAMRKAIRKLIDVGLLDDTAGDVVLEYIQHLGKNTVKNIKKPGDRASSEATNLAKALRDAGLKSEATRRQTKKTVSIPLRPMPAHSPQPNWKAR